MKLGNATIYRDGGFVTEDFSLSSMGAFSIPENCIVVPGFVDVHVHLREPGFSYKETIASGTAAGAAGGYTALCSMPNLSPVPDSMPNLEKQLEIIRRDAKIAVYPYGALTVEEKGEVPADLEDMAPYVIAFSDDGRGIQDEDMMRHLMLRAKALGKMVVAHCEDMALVKGGYIHDGTYAAAHGHKGICSESEWKPIERDLRLAEETGCAYHVCHVSCKESVELIRRAKARGVNVTCETGPHYLVLDDTCLEEDGRFKMNPPLRAPEDREALLAGLLDGTVDMIATDHAPHSAEEKGRGLANSAMGVVGLETAFPVLYTHLVKTGKLPLEKLIHAMAIAPRKRFGIPMGEDFTVLETATPFTVDPEKFLTAGRATPFAGMTLYGRTLLTVHNGKVVYAAPQCL